MKLLRISLSLNKNGFEWKRMERAATEKAATYMIEPIEAGDAKRRMPKENLMQPARWITDHSLIEYSIWCFPQLEEDAKAILNEKVLSTAMTIKSEWDKVAAHL